MRTLHAFNQYMSKRANVSVGGGVESIAGKVSGVGGEPEQSPLQTTGPQSRLPIKSRVPKLDGSDTPPGAGGVMGSGDGNALGGGPSATL